MNTQPIEYCLFWIQWWPLCMSRTDWASWVQGVGTVAAVFAAVVVAYTQSAQQRAERISRNADRIADRFAAPISVAAEALRELQEFVDLRSAPVVTATGGRLRTADHTEERAQARLERTIDESTRLDPLKMPSIESIAAVRDVVNAVQDAQRALKFIPPQRPIGSIEEAMAQGRFNEALQRIREARSKLESESARLSTPGKR